MSQDPGCESWRGKHHHHSRKIPNYASLPARARMWILRASLRRRLFVWFGVAIACSSALSYYYWQGCATELASEVRTPAQLAAVLAAGVGALQGDAERALAFERDIQVAYPSEQWTWSAHGQAHALCTHPARSPIDVGEGQPGEVAVCPRIIRGSPRRYSRWYSVAGGVVLLWILAGIVARRISRPVERLVVAADQLRTGDLTARVAIGHQRAPDLRIVADAFNRMAEKLQRDLEGQRHLLAMVSHELKTPLARLAFLMERARAPEDTQDALTRAERELVHMSALVTDLLASSRTDLGALNLSVVRGRDAAATALESAAMDPALLAFIGEVDDIEVDATLLQRALVNLLENARKHAGGVSGLEVSSGAGYVVFSVSDAGPGFPAGTAERVGAAFALSPARPTGTALPGIGSGLGLGLVARIAGTHGGELRLENKPVGACASLRIPLAAQAERARK